MTTDTAPSANWKVRDVLSTLGPPKAMRKRCAELGLAAPSIGVVKMWRSRASIPGAWSPTIVLLLLHAGERPQDFIEIQRTNPF